MKVKNLSNHLGSSFKTSAFLIALLYFISSQSFAAGLLIAEGQFGGKLKIESHDVKVTINNGIAVTEVTQIFRNTENRQLEALYTFPIPNGASVSNFSMWIKGKEMIGEVVEKERARKIYNSYKRKNVDPGLLEQVDFKRFEMRIFPILAKASQKVKITYYQELNFDHDWVNYVYPLATVTVPGLTDTNSSKFSMNVDVKSMINIDQMKSPSHSKSFAINKIQDDYYQASLEIDDGNLNQDVVLNYQLKRPVTGLDLITSKAPNEDGFFYLTLTAGEELKKNEIPMDYIFVLDVSGSMRKESKLNISNQCILAFLNELSDEDRVQLITYNTSPKPHFPNLRKANQSTKNEINNNIQAISPAGGTEIIPALSLAYQYANKERPINIVIFSDGLAEKGYPKKLANMMIEKSENKKVKIFCIGVGNEINKGLLKDLAQDTGGFAAFISEGDDITRNAVSFRRKLTRPIASDIEINIDGVKVHDIVPNRLPNMYHGKPIRIYGRYKGSGESEISLKAKIAGQNISQKVNLKFPKNESNNPEIERMWAYQKIEELSQDIKDKDRNHKNISSIIRLGEDYSIVTPYTSFLVLENNGEYKRWKIERRNALRVKRDRRSVSKLREQLKEIRLKSAVALGPQAKEEITNTTNPTSKEGTRLTRINKTKKTNNQRPPRKRNSADLNFGGGPIGVFLLPLFLLIAILKKRANKHA